MDNIKLVTSFEKNADNLSSPVEKDISEKHRAYSTFDTSSEKNAENLKTPVEEDINRKQQAYSTWKKILSPLSKKVLELQDICRRRHQRKTSSILDLGKHFVTSSEKSVET
jgi:hypothetical protein